MENLKLCEINKVSKYIEDFIYGFVDEMKLRVKYAEH